MAIEGSSSGNFNIWKAMAVSCILLIQITSKVNGKRSSENNATTLADRRRALMEEATKKPPSYFFEQMNYRKEAMMNDANDMMRFIESAGGHFEEYESPKDREMSSIREPQLSAQFFSETKQPCPGGKSCAVPITPEQRREVAIENLKNNILKELNMKEPPNVSARNVDLNSPPVQRILRRHGIKVDRLLEEELEDPEYEKVETTKETVISYAKPPLMPALRGMHFNFSEEDLAYSVTSAELWVHTKGNPLGRMNTTLEFYHNVMNEDGTYSEELFYSKLVVVRRRGEWRKFVITNEVQRWFTDYSTNLGIDIRSPDIPNFVSQAQSDRTHKTPILEVEISHTRMSRRRKRSADRLCSTDEQDPTCCRSNFTVEFYRLGWEWIISPRVLTTYHCHGECSFMNLKSNYQRMHRQISSTPDMVQSCCTPTKMEPVKMLYFDNTGNIIFSNVDNMKIVKCGCQ